MSERKHLTIKSWAKEDQPREKLEYRGAAQLSDAELLAILISTGTKNITALDIGKLLLHEFSIRDLSEQSWQSLTKTKGLGKVKAIKLAAAFELARRIEAVPVGKKMKISSPKQIYEIYGPTMRDLKQEVFKIVLLNAAGRIIRDTEITKGTLNATLIHAREVFKPAIDERAAMIILIHNHPSGSIDPSEQDIQITGQMKNAGNIIGIPVKDHIIIAGNKFTSMAQLGYL